MEIHQLFSDFYSVQRDIMETDIFYLICCITVGLVLFFFSKKSSLLSLFPLVSAVLRYLSVIYEEYSIVKYITSSVLRFIIASYILTYGIIYFTKIALMVGAGVALLHFTDKYSEYLDIPFYNWAMLVIVGLTFYNVKKMQTFVCTLIASIYSSLILLNSIEILAKRNLEMKNLDVLGAALTAGLSFSSIFIQNFIHKSKTK